MIGIPQAIILALREHLSTYVLDEPGALLFPGAKGGALRRSGFNTRTRWVDVVREMGMTGLHFHDLRHTGNMLAAKSGAGLKDLMARMGHDNIRAAISTPYAGRTRRSRTRSTSTSAEQVTRTRTAQRARSSPSANCTLIARKIERCQK
ncbi:tyrosine-type recombinase/integrase [Microtetraspora malaysiensis]|uniref:Tyrosine-type recombinase/integrase n=1 Tax=Microtetraspora malaysiensis TaxID=161358 RepID=A0ABW6SJE8_9ACTN